PLPRHRADPAADGRDVGIRDLRLPAPAGRPRHPRLRLTPASVGAASAAMPRPDVGAASAAMLFALRAKAGSIAAEAAPTMWIGGWGAQRGGARSSRRLRKPSPSLSWRRNCRSKRAW